MVLKQQPLMKEEEKYFKWIIGAIAAMAILNLIDEMTTHFESITYRFILRAIELDNYPKYAYEG